MTRQTVRALCSGIVVIAAACLSACAQTSIPTASPASTAMPASPAAAGPTGASLAQIAVTLAATTLPSGAMQSLHAIGVFDDGSNADVSDLVTWQSSDPRIAMVDVADTGATLYAVDAGAADVIATLGPVRGAVHVTIAAALRSIVLSPGTTNIAPCGARQLTAIGSFSDGTQHDVTALAAWSTSDAAIATIAGDGPRGVLVAMAPGTVTVTASYGDVAGTLTLIADSTVPKMIAVSPTNLTVTAGDSIGFTTTATYCDESTADVTMAATWSSSAPDVASITDVEAGMYVATATSAGTALISARLDDLFDAIELQVAPPTLRSISIDLPSSTAATGTVAVGSSTALAATAMYSDGSSQDITSAVTWSSSNDQIATVSPAGVVTAVAAGQVTVMVAMDGLFGSVALTITQ